MSNSTQTSKSTKKAPPVSAIVSLDFGHSEEEDLLKQEILNAAESFQNLETSSEAEEIVREFETELVDSDEESALEEYEQTQSFVAKNKSKLLIAAAAAAVLIALVSAIGGQEQTTAEAEKMAIPLLPSEQAAEVETKATEAEDVATLKMPMPQKVAEN